MFELKGNHIRFLRFCASSEQFERRITCTVSIAPKHFPSNTSLLFGPSVIDFLPPSASVPCLFGAHLYGFQDFSDPLTIDPSSK